MKAKYEIDRDQAVRDYLDKIEEDAPLWEGSEWVKVLGVNAIYAKNHRQDGYLELLGIGRHVKSYAYTFLRLDLREETK